mmetsp:Transcript_18774/g.49855  ORF Transcript_18774/g.49855 Transcript_18774/m.49855 type:complete len:138 (-) Transcript_18774:40-453(-)
MFAVGRSVVPSPQSNGSWRRRCWRLSIRFVFLNVCLCLPTTCARVVGVVLEPSVAAAATQAAAQVPRGSVDLVSFVASCGLCSDRRALVVKMHDLPDLLCTAGSLQFACECFRRDGCCMPSDCMHADGLDKPIGTIQ